MRWIYLRPIGAVAAITVLAGCQHLSPEPLDLRAQGETLRSQTLDVPPVRDFAAALDALGGEDCAGFDPADGLTLCEAQAVALWYNLDLRVMRFEGDQAAALAGAAGRWDDPAIGLERGRKSVDEDGGLLRDAGGVKRSWINAASLSITIPLSGRPAAERRLRGTEHDVARLRVAEAEWDTVTAVREAWARWSVTRERVALLDTHLELLEQFTQAAESLADAGELSPTRARLFHIEHARRSAERTREAQAEAEARFGVIELLGLLPDAPVKLVPRIHPGPDPDALIPQPEDHPAIARLRAEYQAAEVRLRVELRKQYPDLTLSPNYADEENETALVIGLGFPVPVWNANRAGIAEAAGARDIARARAIAAYQHLQAEYAQALSALAGSREQHARLRTEAAPAVDTQLAESRALLDVGEIDIVVLYETLGQALAVKQELLNAALAESIAGVRLEAAAAAGAIRLAAPVETDQ